MSTALVLVAFAGGLLTIVSPCILPVLPFVFARVDQPFRRSGLPTLLGMAVAFAIVGAVATVAGDWVVRANQWGRVFALVVFALLGASLLVPALADAFATPFVGVGRAIEQRASRDSSSIPASLLLGVGIGLLWAPCAGPILGLVLATVALQGTTAASVTLLLSFAAGAVAALGIVLWAGGRLVGRLKRALGVEAWIRRGLGVAVLVGVAAIALGADTGILARLSLDGFGTATAVEQRLVDRVAPEPAAPAMTMAPQDPGAMMMMSGAPARGAVVTAMPPLTGGPWFNSEPLTVEGLRGKVVLIDFWTYSCINCLRAIPYVDAWARKYRDAGLVVIGVHTPEFAFERDPARVNKAIRDLHVSYPVVVDNQRDIWNAFRNRFWPSHFLIDRDGQIQYRHAGEGDYDETEAAIQRVLGQKAVAPQSVVASGAQAAPDLDSLRSAETYLGHERQENFVSPEGVKADQVAAYTVPKSLELNQWGLAGRWRIADEKATLEAVGGAVEFRFHARDLHLVLGPAASGMKIRFRVFMDGKAPGANHGVDVDPEGRGVVTEYRLYQLVRQAGAVEDRTFRIEFEDSGVEAFAFTFG